MTAKLEISRTFNAPKELVFKAFSEAEHLEKWWGPEGWEFQIAQFDFRPGGLLHYSQKSPEGDIMWVKFLYTEVNSPDKLVYTYFFSDAAGNVVRAPFHESWPLKMQNTFTLVEHEGKTTLTMVGTTIDATEAELQTFMDSVGMMQEGFGATFDRLAELLPQLSPSH